MQTDEYDDREPTEEEIARFVNSFRETFYTEHKEYDPNIPLSDQSQKIRDEVENRTMSWCG